MKNTPRTDIAFYCLVLLAVMGILYSFIERPGTPSYTAVKLFNSDGQINMLTHKIWVDTVLMSTNTAAINISSADFADVWSVSVVGLKNSSSPTTFPMFNIESFTQTVVNIKMYSANGSLINILGNNVLLGGATQNYSSPSGVWAIITVTGC